MSELESALADVRARLRLGAYSNRDEVRFALVARLLQTLKWNIWDPSEVLTGNAPLAGTEAGAGFLLSTDSAPATRIEIRSPEDDENRSSETETPLNDLRQEHRTGIHIITNGRKWQFSLHRDEGPASRQCFAQIDVLGHDLYEIERSLWTFLGKRSIEEGTAERNAKKAIVAARHRRAMAASLPEARQRAQTSPQTSLSEILVDAVAKMGMQVTVAEAEAFIEECNRQGVSPSKKRKAIASRIESGSAARNSADPRSVLPGQVHELRPDGAIDLRYTALESGQIGDVHIGRWGSLLDEAIRIASTRGMSLHELKRITNVDIRKGKVVDSTFRVIEGTHLSVQMTDPTHCYINAFLLAKNLGLELCVQFRWHNRDGAAHPGEKGAIHWRPPG